MSFFWHVPFSVSQPLAAFPRPQVLAKESRGAEYYCEGRFRTGEMQILFQYTLSGRGIFRDADGEHPIERYSILVNQMVGHKNSFDAGSISCFE